MGGEDDKLFFYPVTVETDNIIEELRERLEIVHSSKFNVPLFGILFFVVSEDQHTTHPLSISGVQGFASLDDLDKAISENGKQNLFAILFHNTSNQALEYTIRNRNAPNLVTDRIFRNNYNELNYRQDDDYIKSGFIKLQVSINELFLRHRNVTPFPVSRPSLVNTYSIGKGDPIYFLHPLRPMRTL